jgi:GntR family transcriptional regulator, transcriptional repressor for pyruvate dehydrogenase complex
VSLRPAVRRTNLPATIANRLRAQIVSGELPPGSRLPGHRDLAAAHAVSVGSMREAISMLISNGLIETRAGQGTYVAASPQRAGPPRAGVPLLREEVEELTEARRVIEVQVAALAAERATPEQVEALRRATERMEAAAANPYEYPEADVDFHLVLAEAAGNRYLLQAMVDIRALLRQDMELGAEAAIRRFGDLRPSVESHRRLLEAIADGDAARATEVADEIVSRNQKFVLGLYALAHSTEAAGG